MSIIVTMKKSRWRQFERGDLVQIHSRISVNEKGGVTFAPTGIVLDSFDSNVYESASCCVLANGEIMHISTRQLKMLKECQNDK